jgi:hypothetical protein
VEAPAAYRCSVNLDDARKQEEPNAARWDYALATDRLCVAMEVHPARGSEVDVMIRKKQWAESLLGPAVSVARWSWVVPQGSPIQLTAASPQARRLAAGGVEFPSRRLVTPS